MSNQDHLPEIEEYVNSKLTKYQFNINIFDNVKARAFNRVNSIGMGNKEAHSLDTVTISVYYDKVILHHARQGSREFIADYIKKYTTEQNIFQVIYMWQGESKV